MSGVAIEFSEGATDVATVPFIVGAMGACTVAAQVDEVDGTAIPVAWLMRDRVSGVAIEFSEGATDVATVPFIVSAMGTSVVAAHVDEVDGIMVPVAWLMRDRVSGVTVEYCGGDTDVTAAPLNVTGGNVSTWLWGSTSWMDSPGSDSDVFRSGIVLASECVMLSDEVHVDR